MPSGLSQFLRYEFLDECLGIEMTICAQELNKGRQYSDFDWPTFKSRLMPLLITAKKFGLWVPDEKMIGAGISVATLINYLQNVGRMLREGHYAEAKQTALQAKEAIAEIVAEDEKTARLTGSSHQTGGAPGGQSEWAIL